MKRPLNSLMNRIRKTMPKKDNSNPKPLFFVYLLECRNKTYYCGYTNNIENRLIRHNAGHGGHYTKSHRPVTLVYFEPFGTQKKAMRRERQIKTYSRKQKQALIKNTINP